MRIEPAPSDHGEFGEDFDVGDVNRDGWLDIVGGAYCAKVGSNSCAGKVSILFGPDFQQAQGQVLNGSVYYGFFGQAVEVEDLDHDGFAEVLVGEPFYSTGRVHVYRHETLRALGPTTVSLAAGGSVAMALECGKLSAAQSYLVLGSATGSSPGLDFSGATGPLHLPLNIDARTAAL